MILGNTLGETRTLIGAADAALFDLTWDRLRPALEENSPFMGRSIAAIVIASYRSGIRTTLRLTCSSRRRPTPARGAAR
jgi:hypothetical protein